MDLHRRDFFKVLGATGISLAIGKELNASPRINKETEFHGVLYDSTRCTGCRGCEYDCAEANNLPEPPATKDIKGIRKPDE
ncbi:MAG: hypothetical protein WCJ95_23090, partial [Mariniphaga sp.]